MARNAFELRFDVIQLAREHLTMQYDASFQRVSMIMDEAARMDALKNLNFPTMEAILDLASKLRGFVDGNVTNVVDGDLTVTGDIKVGGNGTFFDGAAKSGK